MQVEQAIHIVKNAGYQVKPLFPIPLPQMEESSIDLTLVIPVYNAERFLPICIQSVLNQHTQYHYEVICVNDGSSDKSAEILEQYARQYNNLRIYTQPNEGISAARNTGIIHARGTYIGFVDNDDYVADSYVEKMLTAAFQHNADVVQIGYDRVDEDRKLLYSYHKGDFVAETDDYIRLYDSLRGTIWGGCFHRHVFRDIRFPVGYWYEDMINKMVLLRLTKRLVSINESLYYWVARTNSAMSTYWKSYKIQALDQIWLPMMLHEYSTNVLRLPDDDLLRTTFLHENSYILFVRTHKLPMRIRRAVYTLAKNNLQKMHIIRGDRYAPVNYLTFTMWNIVCFVRFFYLEFRRRIG